MLRPVRTNRFKKDVELARKRGNDLNKLRAVMEKLLAEEPLEAWHRDYPLVGGYAGRQECHLELALDSALAEARDARAA